MENILTSWLISQKIAHRGLHNRKSAPENSRQAFENAILSKFAIELDVQMISDGTLVVIHDYTLDRTTTGRGKVSELKKEDLKRIKLKGTNELLPTFDEVYAMPYVRESLECILDQNIRQYQILYSFKDDLRQEILIHINNELSNFDPEQSAIQTLFLHSS